MTNRHDISRLEDFLDGELSPGEEATFKENLASSPVLKAELRAAERLKSLLGRLPAAEPPDEYFQEVTDIILARTVGDSRERTNSANVPITSLRPSLVTITLQVAASLVLFFAALSLSQTRQEQASVVMPAVEYLALTNQSESSQARAEWEMTDSELSELAIGITAVSSPGLACGSPLTIAYGHSVGNK